MRRSFPLLSVTLAASLVCAPLLAPASAAAANPLAFAAPAEEAAAEDPALVEAKGLYKQGEVEFQTGDYQQALDLWKRAFAMLPDGDDTRAIRHALVYNIAEAHSRAYEVSRNPTHLRTAKVMLETYRKEHRALYGDEGDAVKERTEVDDRIAELDNKIDASVAAGEQATPLSESNSGDVVSPAPPPTYIEPLPQPTPKPMTPQQQWEAEVKADPELGPKWEKGNKRLVGGAVLTGIGLPFLIGGVVVFVAAAQAQAAVDATPIDDPFADNVNNLGVGLTWAGAVALTVVGVGLTVPGGVLLGTGISARNQVIKAKPRPTARLIPQFGPRGGGLTYQVRF